MATDLPWDCPWSCGAGEERARSQGVDRGSASSRSPRARGHNAQPSPSIAQVKPRGVKGSLSQAVRAGWLPDFQGPRLELPGTALFPWLKTAVSKSLF